MKATKMPLMISILFLLFFSCSTKNKAIEREKQKLEQVSKKDSTENVSRETLVNNIEKIDQKKELFNDSNLGDFELSGETEESKPFFLYNIQNKDTISSIKITGKSSFKIKNSWERSIKKDSEYKYIDLKKDTLKTTKKEFSDKKEIKLNSSSEKVVKNKKVTDFSYTFYIWLGIILLIIILFYLFYRFYGKNITDFLKKIKDKL